MVGVYHFNWEDIVKIKKLKWNSEKTLTIKKRTIVDLNPQEVTRIKGHDIFGADAQMDTNEVVSCNHCATREMGITPGA